MPIYRPRMLAFLTVPIAGSGSDRKRAAESNDPFMMPVRPYRCSLEKNDHNHADACEITLDWTEAGVDPRMLDNACVEVHIGNADDRGFWTTSRETCRFIGVTHDIHTELDSDNPGSVKLSCLDYTTRFLEAKPFGSKGIPDYGQRLDEAWERIVSQTPGAGILAKRLRLEGLAEWPKLGTAVSERFRKLAKVPTHPKTDAWAVWQQTCGMMGLITYIDRDECVVTTTRALYTQSDAPVFLWGRNIERWRETRQSQFVKRGVGVTAYDPLAGRSLDAFYPPLGDPRVQHKRPVGKKIGGAAPCESTEERDWFIARGITEDKALLAFAERVYDERSRQELEGEFTTAEMEVSTEGARLFDVLDMSPGDNVVVQVERGNAQLLSSMPSHGERLAYLRQRGYTVGASELIIANMKEFANLSAKFHVKGVRVELETTGDSGHFSVECQYVNRIELNGSAVA